ncbi:hypothetical protein SRHO_G00076500 [Serrasalmus rhombeus]
MLGAKPKLILASTPNPANNNSDKGWILVRGKERGSNQHNGCGKQPSSGQNILLDNRYEALASTRVEETEQSHLNILPPSPGQQGHQAQHNLHQRNNSSLASKQQHGNNSGHMRINHQTANRASRQHANKHAKGISHQNGNTCANHLASSHARQLAKSVSHQCGHTRPNHQLANHAGRQLTNVHANRASHRDANRVSQRDANRVGQQDVNRVGQRDANRVSQRDANHVIHQDANHVSCRGINGGRRRGAPPQPKTLLIWGLGSQRSGSLQPVHIGSSISNILCPIYPLFLLNTCPNHLNLASLALSPNCSTFTVPLICSFLILSILVTPNENLSTFISATSSSASCLLDRATSRWACLRRVVAGRSRWRCDGPQEEEEEEDFAAAALWVRMSVLYSVMAGLAVLLLVLRRCFPNLLHDFIYLLKVVLVVARLRRLRGSVPCYTVLDCFLDAVQKQPEKKFIIFEGQTYSYREADRASNKVAQALLRQGGLREGDTIQISAALLVVLWSQSPDRWSRFLDMNLLPSGAFRSPLWSAERCRCSVRTGYPVCRHPSTTNTWTQHQA